MSRYIKCTLTPQVLIVSGPIGSGKSKIAEQFASRAKDNGYQVYGIISKRVMVNGETIGYDGLDPQTGKTTQLVYHRDMRARIWAIS